MSHSHTIAAELMRKYQHGQSSEEGCVLLFEAALSQRGKCFTLDAEGEATLTLQVPEQFAKVLSDQIHRLRNCSFVVRIDGLEG